VNNQEAAQHHSRLIATSFMALFAIVGLTLYGLPLYYPKFMTELGWTRGEVTFGNMLGKLAVGPLFGFLVGWMIERRGPRAPLIIGLLVAGSAVALLGTTHVYAMFLACYCLNALGYVLAGPLPNQVLLSNNFHEQRGRAMGIAYVGIGIGAFFVPQLTKHLQAEFGWRTALQLLGLVIVVCGMPLVLMLRPNEVRPPAPKGPQASLEQVLKSPSFYLVAIGSFASVGAVGAVMQHMMVYMTLDQGRNEAQALNVMSWIAAASLLGRFSAGWLADRLGPKRVMLLVYMLVAAGAGLLVLGANGPLIYLFAVIFGLGLGGEYMIIPLMAGQLFGIGVLGRVMGIIVTFDGVAEAAIPYFVARMHKWSSSYSQGFQFVLGLAIFGFIAILLIPVQKRLSESASSS
jgi:MFS family permease